MAQTGFKDKMSYWQTTGLLLAVLLYVFSTTFIPIPEANQRMADTSLGFLLGSVLSVIVNYIYGNSRTKKSEVDQKAEQDGKEKI